jgi:hypothetical protein
MGWKLVEFYPLIAGVWRGRFQTFHFGVTLERQRADLAEIGRWIGFTSPQIYTTCVHFYEKVNFGLLTRRIVVNNLQWF